MIVAGASSYPRRIDYETLADIAKSVSAYLMVDMAHIGGLVAAKVLPSPVSVADFVTFTCYKTMMGGRGGVILCRELFAKAVDRALFPGCQGTSAVNSIAAKAVIFKLAMEDGFIRIQQNTVENARTLARLLAKKGYDIVTGGTDTHQVIVDLRTRRIDGKTAEEACEKAGIILNKNVIPGDEEAPGSVSGIRIGVAAATARGMGAEEMSEICDLLHTAISQHQHAETLETVRGRVATLCSRFPVYHKKRAS
jgi:glycine hydroxymethyltransferase